jgi:hypothetical protein
MNQSKQQQTKGSKRRKRLAGMFYYAAIERNKDRK